MGKFALKMGVLILINLFAFIILGLILDALFETEGTFLVFMVVLSIFPLSLIMMLQIQKAKKELDGISPNKENKTDGTNS